MMQESSRTLKQELDDSRLSVPILLLGMACLQSSTHPGLLRIIYHFLRLSGPGKEIGGILGSGQPNELEDSLSSHVRDENQMLQNLTWHAMFSRPGWPHLSPCLAWAGPATSLTNGKPIRVGTPGLLKPASKTLDRTS